MDRFIPPGMGWIPDVPDPRDFTVHQEPIRSLLGRLRRRRARDLPPRVDLRQDADGIYLSPAESQAMLGCSAVFACLSLVEYFQRRALGQTFEPSRLFVYKMARKLRGCPGNSGVDLRSTWKAIARYGMPPERLWPFELVRFDEDPLDIGLIGFARESTGMQYIRLDNPGITATELLYMAKAFLASRLPFVCGFAVPSSLTASPEIPYRPSYDSIRGGQAVLTVGYSDEYFGAKRGAFLIRSSWGSGWGEAGYGWLPYEYVLRQLARDFWTVLRDDWIESALFYRPSIPTIASAGKS